jgi:hypothetical protein
MGIRRASMPREAQHFQPHLCYQLQHLTTSRGSRRRRQVSILLLHDDADELGAKSAPSL